MPLETPPKVPIKDVLLNVRAVINTIVDTLLVDGEATPDGFKLITSQGEELQIDLSSIFLKRTEVAAIAAVGPATEDRSGSIKISTDELALELEDDTTAMTPAKVGLVLLKKGLTFFQFDDMTVGQVITVDQMPDGTLYLKPADPQTALAITLQIATENGAETSIMPFFKGGVNATLPIVPEGVKVTNVVVGDDGQFYRQGDTAPVSIVTWTVLEQYIEVDDEVIVVPPPPPFTARASVENNDCDFFGGWVFSNQNYPEQIRIEVDGKFEAFETAKIARKDVKDYLADQGIITNNTVFQFNHQKNKKWKDGKPHTWRAYVGNTTVEAFEYHAPQQITCAAPVDNTPTVVKVEQTKIVSVNKAGDSKTISLEEILSNGDKRAYSGSEVPVWEIEGAPAGIVAVPYNPNKTIDVVANAQTTVNKFVVKCSLTEPQTVQVLTVGCTRPAGLSTFQASYHFIPDGEFSDPAYPTLAAANEAIGKKFDGTRPGNLDLFPVQIESLEKGKPVFLGTTDSCEKAGNNIYGLTDSSSGNTIKKAIQVIDGVIAAIEVSTYQTPTGPNNAPVRNYSALFLTAQEGVAFSYKFLDSKFTDPNGDALSWSMEFSIDNDNYVGLPSWASFDKSTKEFSGTGPLPSTNARSYYFRIKVEDGRGGVAYDSFLFQVVRKNYALASEYGATATASSTYAGFDPNFLLNGFTRAIHDNASWGKGEGWNSGASQPPADQWVEIDLKKSRLVGCVDVFTLYDDYEFEYGYSDTFTKYGVTAFRIQVPDGSGWRTVATVSGNNQVRRTVTFEPVTTSRIRVLIDAAADNAYARLLEIEVFNAHIQ